MTSRDDGLLSPLPGWYAASARALPWRDPACSAWGILVSEVMLQQTPVVRVLPRWGAWMDRWPDAAALAAAVPADVLRAWGSLGYPRRALRLQECARTVVSAYGGVPPSTVDELLTLPGVGDYTARAVACWAHGARVPVVDVNVRRVIARAVDGRAEPGPATTRRDLRAVEALLPADAAAAGVVSAALMELGALVCVVRDPRCEACPLRGACAWVRAGRPAHRGPARRGQRFAGTDRQVRGLLLGVLRDTTGPVPRDRLDAVWDAAGQRDRALDSLLVDGLIEQTTDGRFALPGEA